jgi:alkylation response protein AidB-like acyl-CoA dehydrogenase
VRCAKQAGRVRLVVRDLAALQLPPVHTLAVACHDVLNHLPSEAALRRVLGSVRRALAPGGVFVFDALTDWAFEHYWPDNTHRLEGPHGDLWMDCDYDPVRRRGTVQMTAYVKGARGAYTRHETTLHEYAWSDRELTRALRSAGFAEVWRMPWSPWPDQHGEPQLERALWAGGAAGRGRAQPPGAGLPPDALSGSIGKLRCAEVAAMPVPSGCAFLIEPVPDDVFVLEDFGEEARAMARTAQEFVDREVIPRLGEIEEKKHGVVPNLLRRAGEIGLLAIEVPEAYGGLGLDKSTALLVSERAAKLGSFSISWGAHTGIGTLPIVYYGSEAQKQHYLPKLASGEWLAAYALTEPGSGSDALASATTARRDGDHWVLSGTSSSSPTRASRISSRCSRRRTGSSALPVERTDPGVARPRGAEARPQGSSTRQLLLDDARIPADRLLGEVGRGHKIAFNILNVGRFKLGAGALGAARECLRFAVDYGRERKQFGKPIVEFGMVQRKIADMATRLYAADSMAYRTAGLLYAAVSEVPATGPEHDAGHLRVLESTRSSARCSRYSAPSASTSWRTSRSRSSAATASCATTRSSVTIAIRASIGSSRARTR